MGLSRRLLALAPAARRPLGLLVVVLLVITATYVGQGLLVALALGRLFDGLPVTAILTVLAGVVALQALRSALIALREPLALRASGLVKAAVRQRLVAQLLALGPGWLQRTRTGNVQSTVVDGVETLDNYVGQFLPQAVAAVLGATAVTTYLVVLDPLVGVIVLVCAVVTPIVPSLSRRLLADRNRAWFAAYRGLYAENLDAVQGMATLKAFNASARHGADLNARAVAFCRDSVRLVGVVVLYVGVVAFMVGVGTAAAVGIGAVRLAEGDLGVGALLIILLLAREAFRPLSDLEGAYHGSYAARPACTSIFELLDADPEVAEPPRKPGLAPAAPRPPPRRRPPARRSSRSPTSRSPTESAPHPRSTDSRSTWHPGSGWRWSAGRERARRRRCRCCCVSSTPTTAGSPSPTATSATCRWRSCAPWSRWSRRTPISSTAACAATSIWPAPKPARKNWWPPRARPAPTTSSPRCPRATTR